MKFKHLSSDFAAEYNRVLDSHRAEQESLNKKYDKKINNLVAEEAIRLQENFKDPFPVGSKVKTDDGRVGKVLHCPVELSMRKPDEYEYSTSRYFSLKDSDCEQVITCEGNIKKVVVEFEASDIEKDWGHKTVTRHFWSDELVQIG